MVAPLPLDLTEVFSFALSATRLSRITAAVPEFSDFGPIVFHEKS
jgi:hypothetical protein